MKTCIFIQTQFIATHFWANAPEDVAFLRNPHRHIFHVRVDFEIWNDRQLEFFQMKEKMDLFIASQFKGKTFAFSCEEIALQIYCFFLGFFYTVVKVEVSEDGENGSYVTGD